jgi:hypothetical protein
VVVEPIEAGRAKERQADDAHAVDGAAAEGGLEGGFEAAAGGLGRADVGAHAHGHADVGRDAAEARADEEGDGREGEAAEPVDGRPDDDEDEDAHKADGAKLPVEVGHGARPDCGADFLHSLIAGRQADDVAGEREGEEDGQHGRREGAQEFQGQRHLHVLPRAGPRSPRSSW